MIPETCVVVPTYWTRAGAEIRVGDAVYDHPTPVNGESTFRKLLTSLEALDTSAFYLLVLVAVTGWDVAEEAEARVRELIDQCTSIVSLVFGPTHLRPFHTWLRERGLEEATSFLDLSRYPRIRNLQLAIPHALHSRAVVAVDDDEIVTDPDFLRKATEPLGSSVDGVRVDGLSGHYEQENGSIMLQVPAGAAQASNVFTRKAAIMNAATERLESQPGNVVQTPFCFGGNMEFTPELIAAVGFDPEITRGEDIDYLINARMEGKHFFLRKDLHILHCPPKGGSYRDASTSKLEQDVIRFMYERQKLIVSQSNPDLHPLTADDLMPYPGEFLDRDIEGDARQALESAGYSGDVDSFMDTVKRDLPRKVSGYLEFRRHWPAAMDALYRSPEMYDQLAGEVRGA